MARKPKNFDIYDVRMIEDPTIPLQEWGDEPEMEGASVDIHARVRLASEVLKKAFLALTKSKRIYAGLEPQQHTLLKAEIQQWDQQWKREWNKEDALARVTKELIDYHYGQARDEAHGSDHEDHDDYSVPLLQRRWRHFTHDQLGMVNDLAPRVQKLAADLEGREPFDNFLNALQNYTHQLNEAELYFNSPSIKKALPHVESHTDLKIPRDTLFWHEFGNRLKDPERRNFSTDWDSVDEYHEMTLENLKEQLTPKKQETQPTQTETLAMGWTQTVHELTQTIKAVKKLGRKTAAEGHAAKHLQQKNELREEFLNALLKRLKAIETQPSEEEQDIEAKAKHTVYIQNIAAGVPATNVEQRMKEAEQDDAVGRLAQRALQCRVWMREVMAEPYLTASDRQHLLTPLKEYIQLFNVLAPTVLAGNSDYRQMLHVGLVVQDQYVKQTAKGQTK